MADGRICVSVLEGSFTGLEVLVSPCRSASTCKTWDCSLEVLSGQLSSPTPDSPFPSFSQSKTVLRLVLTDLVRSTEGVGRRPDACLDGPLAV